MIDQSEGLPGYVEKMRHTETQLALLQNKYKMRLQTLLNSLNELDNSSVKTRIDVLNLLADFQDDCTKIRDGVGNYRTQLEQEIQGLEEIIFNQ